MSTDLASLSAEDLLLRVSIGDVSAFDTLYSVKMPVVRAAAMQLLRDRHHAEDVAQKVMVSIWQCAARFNPLLGSANAWILQVTRHKAIDRIRTAEFFRRQDNSCSEPNRVFGTDDVADAAVARCDSGPLDLALLQLTAVQRQAFGLAFFSRLTYPQFAASLNVPLGTFKNRVRDSLLKLRAILSDRR